MERFLSFQYKIGTKPKLKEILIPLLGQNGTFAFILAKIETNQKQKEFVLPTSEGNGTFTFIPVIIWNKTKAKEIFRPNLRAKWNVLFCSK
jgi:hypothetical protein